MAQPREVVSEIIAAYDDRIIQLYCWVRFRILRQRFLDEIGQYLPTSGTVLDIGCGFGLFSLYYARLRPRLRIVGIDTDARRIDIARRAAARLGIGNVHYDLGDAAALVFQGPFDAVYVLDIVHHIPRSSVPPLVVPKWPGN